MEKQKIIAIVAAYNEENRIKTVLDVLENSRLINEIIVVDDGSIDNTSKDAIEFSKVKLIKHKKNLGKGEAIKTSIRETEKNDILLFVDADLIGFEDSHVNLLVEPVLSGLVDMTMGLLGKDVKRGTNIASRMIPAITGMRALRKEFLENINIPSGYGVDIVITKAVKKKKGKIIKIDLSGTTQFMKEEKHGPKSGLKHRAKMYKEVILKK